MYLGFNGEGALVVASEDVESDAGDQIDLGVETDGLGAFTLVLISDGAIQGQLRRGLG